MARLRYNNALGTLGASLTSSGTTITFASAPAFSTITSPDYIPLVLEPALGLASSGNFEIVYLTAYTAGALTGTILRAQEGTSGVSHASGVAWECGPVAADFPSLKPVAVTGTATYNAQPGDWVAANIFGGNVIVNLPSAPADRTQIGVQISSSNPSGLECIIELGSGDSAVSFNGAFQSPGAFVLFQYSLSARLWYVLAQGSPMHHPVGVAPLDSNARLPANRLTASAVTASSSGGIPAWAASTAYSVNQLVTNGGNDYICTTPHTSGSTFSGDASNWQQVGGTGSPSGSAGGDLTGSYPNPTVANISPGAVRVEGQLESLAPLLTRQRTKVSPSLMAAANAASALTISTPDASGQVVEPAVEYIPWGWNGHKYWALITGYTNGDDSTENPSLYYSDDGLTFTSVGPSFFPVAGQPTGGFNDDPEILLGPDNKLHMFWMEAHWASGRNAGTGYIKWCTYDGTTLTTPVAILTFTNTTEMIFAPCVMWDGANDQWVMFYTDGANYINNVNATYPYKMRTCPGTSPNGTWSSPTTLTVNGIPSGQSVWESHIARRGEELHMVTTCCAINTPGTTSGLYFGVSDDGGLTWTLNATPILTASGGSNWDGTLMYRGDIVPLDDASNGAYQLWYSAENSSGAWHMGYTTITRNQSVNAIDGVTVTGTPVSGQVITATGPSGANWQTPSSGGGSLSQLARAYRAAALSWSSTAWQKIPIDTSVFDSGGNLDVSTNHRYNVPANGYYWVSAVAAFNYAGATSTAYAYVAIYKNGNPVAHAGTTENAGSSGAAVIASVSDLISCSSGDYLEIWGFAASGTGLLVVSSGNFAPASSENFLSVIKVA